MLPDVAARLETDWDVEVIETSVNFCDQANLDGALTAAGRNGKGVIAKRPIAHAAWKGRYSPAWHTPVEIVGLYWHFVDIIWIFLFPLLYLIA